MRWRAADSSAEQHSQDQPELVIVSDRRKVFDLEALLRKESNELIIRVQT
jgi:hypothetical protein